MLNIKHTFSSAFAAFLLLQSALVSANQPATQTKAGGFIPVISDFDMKQCVKLSKKAEAEWQELLALPYDEQDEKKMKKVRNQIELHSRMVEQFNKNCAGRQSKSSCEKIKKARAAQGLDYQACTVAKR